MLAPDTLLQNRYLIVRQLGQGGMGTVYEAVDQRLDTTVALKETFFNDERLRKQFEREARLLARLHHPALPRVSDHFTEGEGQFLVMQFIAGEDLAEMIQRNGGAAFPVETVVRWGDQLLDALDYLHTQDPQIVHRDIKPQNLKLTSRGQIILLDFGLAKSFANLLSQVSTTASIFGYTPNYAPLEQIQGLGTDARSDIYSLAATLYHLMTGTKPPDALTRAASVVNGQPDPLQPAQEVNPQISQSVSRVLAQAMSQNREQRYESASAMRKALTGVSQPETIADRSEANTVIMPAATTRAISPATIQQTPPPESETITAVAQKTSPSARSSRAWMIAVPALILILLGCGGIFLAFQRRAQQTPQAEQTAQPVSTNQNSAPSPAPAPSPAASVATQEKVTSAQVGQTPSNSNHREALAQKNVPRTKADKQKSEKDEPDEPDEPVIPETPRYGLSPEDRAKIQEDARKAREEGRRAREEARRDALLNEDESDERPNKPLKMPRTRSRGGYSITRFPDGTRIVTTPNGTKRVFRPGERIDPKSIGP